MTTPILLKRWECGVLDLRPLSRDDFEIGDFRISPLGKDPSRAALETVAAHAVVELHPAVLAEIESLLPDWPRDYRLSTRYASYHQEVALRGCKPATQIARHQAVETEVRAHLAEHGAALIDEVVARVRQSLERAVQDRNDSYVRSTLEYLLADGNFDKVYGDARKEAVETWDELDAIEVRLADLAVERERLRLRRQSLRLAEATRIWEAERTKDDCPPAQVEAALKTLQEGKIFSGRSKRLGPIG